MSSFFPSHRVLTKTVNALIKKLYFGADLDKAYMLSAFLPSMSFHTENVYVYSLRNNIKNDFVLSAS